MCTRNCQYITTLAIPKHSITKKNLASCRYYHLMTPLYSRVLVLGVNFLNMRGLYTVCNAITSKLAFVPQSDCYIWSFLGEAQSSCFQCIVQGIDSVQAQYQMEVESCLPCPAQFQESHHPCYVHLFQLHCSANQALTIKNKEWRIKRHRVECC